MAGAAVSAAMTSFYVDSSLNLQDSEDARVQVTEVQDSTTILSSSTELIPTVTTPKITITKEADETIPEDASAKDTPKSVEDSVDLNDWRLSEVPEALFHVEEDTSPELKKIVEDFRQQCELLRAAIRCAHDELCRSKELQKTPTLHETTLSDESTASIIPSGPNSATTTRSSMTSPSLVSVGSADSKGKTKVETSAASLSAVASQGTGVIFEETPVRKTKTEKLRLLFKGKGKRPLRFSTSTGRIEPSVAVECASCFDDLPYSESIALACTHHYCSECFVQLIQTAMQNENFWPPKCCLQDIPRKKIIKELPESTLKNFGVKEREYATPAKDRWYCTRTTCGQWFEGKKVGSSTKCPHCNYEMCVHCRGERHQMSERCPQDKGRQLLDEEAELEGWRQCYSCLQMVELMQGCRHITCTCKAEFCYTCGLKWKTCACTEDDQRRRNERLKSVREKKVKEESELEEALAAVAAAERRDREQRMLEEKQNLESMEEARIESLKARFIFLKQELETLHVSQDLLLHQSHEEQHKDTLTELETANSNQAKLESELEAQVRSCADKYKDRRGQHGKANEEVLSRHESQQKELKVRLENLVESMLVSEEAATRHETMLQLIQQKELNELWDQQQREIERYETRLEMIRTNPEWGVKRSGLKKALQRIEQSQATLVKRIDNDKKWLNLAKGEILLLATAEQVAISEGEEVVAATIEGLKHDIEAIQAENAEADALLAAKLEQTPIASEFDQQREALLTNKNLPTPSRRVPGAWPIPEAESSRAGAAREAHGAIMGGPSSAPDWKNDLTEWRQTRAAQRDDAGGSAQEILGPEEVRARGARLGASIHKGRLTNRTFR